MTKADLTLIEKVLKEHTGYRISKETGIGETTIGRWVRGETALVNMSLKHAIMLTEFAIRIENENKVL
ncbi:hypothetical protein NHG35_04630 [Aerococcaceae bacterium NML180378]|nr:hypothetical protein [Aerococcaceae bacterium NML180378]MDO4775532.1 hypothetical protein [Aerococcaceae bacterium]